MASWRNKRISSSMKINGGERNVIGVMKSENQRHKPLKANES
jgi:hypothetical protein